MITANIEPERDPAFGAKRSFSMEKSNNRNDMPMLGVVMVSGIVVTKRQILQFCAHSLSEICSRCFRWKRGGAVQHHRSRYVDRAGEENSF